MNDLDLVQVSILKREFYHLSLFQASSSELLVILKNDTWSHPTYKWSNLQGWQMRRHEITRYCTVEKLMARHVWFCFLFYPFRPVFLGTTVYHYPTLFFYLPPLRFHIHSRLDIIHTRLDLIHICNLSGNRRLSTNNKAVLQLSNPI